jgi:hypothetical protein
MSALDVSTAWRTIACVSTRSLRSSILPRLMRDTSRRSSTSRTSCESCRSIIARVCATAARLSPASRITCIALRIGVNGLRSSCASVARNTSLRWSCSLRVAWLWISSASAALRSVMSTSALTAPVTRPSASRNTCG